MLHFIVELAGPKDAIYYVSKGMTARQPTPGLVGWIWVALDQLPFSPASRLPKSKYAERVAAKHPVMLDKRFIHPRRERKED